MVFKPILSKKEVKKVMRELKKALKKRALGVVALFCLVPMPETGHALGAISMFAFCPSILDEEIMMRW